MNIEIKENGNDIVVLLQGRLDTIASGDVAPIFDNLATMASKDITLDCSDLQYISSSGLRLFLALRKSALAMGGNVVVKNINDEIRNVFTMTGFLKLFGIE